MVPVWLAAALVLAAGCRDYWRRDRLQLLCPSRGGRADPDQQTEYRAPAACLSFSCSVNAGYGWPDEIAITVIGAGVLVTLIVSGIDYVWSWSRRARADSAGKRSETRRHDIGNAEPARINWMIAIALIGWLLWLLAPVLTPFVASALLAYIGDPLADRLQKKTENAADACGHVSVFLITFIAISLLVLLVLPLIRTQVGAFLAALPSIVAQAEQVWLPNITGLLGIEVQRGHRARCLHLRDTAIWPATGRGLCLLSLTRGGGALAAAVISLFLIPILTFYLLRDWDLIISRLGALVPSRQRDTDLPAGSRNRRCARRIPARAAAGDDRPGHHLLPPD